jgi:hypothetical protein
VDNGASGRLARPRQHEWQGVTKTKLKLGGAHLSKTVQQQLGHFLESVIEASRVDLKVTSPHILWTISPAAKWRRTLYSEKSLQLQVLHLVEAFCLQNFPQQTCSAEVALLPARLALMHSEAKSL